MFLNDLVKIYYINLDRATDRRALMEEQSKRLGLSVTRVAATTADALDPDLLSQYDVALRRKEYQYDLRPAEHACIQSHLRALKMFLATEYQYAIVLEDDSRLTDGFMEGAEYLITKTSGWQIMRLQSELRKYYTLLGPRDGAPCEIVLPKKPMCASTALLYTRQGAERLLAEFEHYASAFDTHMGRSALLKKIPLGATLPNLVDLFETSESTIGDRSDMKRQNKNSFMQYLRHRVMVVRLSVMKLVMRSLMRRILRILD